MNEELQQLQQSIVAAVQQELTRYSHEVKSEVDRIRDEVSAGATARQALEQQVAALAGALEQSQAANTKYQADLQHALEERLTDFASSTKRRHEEMSTRLGKVIEQLVTMLALCHHGKVNDDSQRRVAALQCEQLRVRVKGTRLLTGLWQMERLRGLVAGVGEDVEKGRSSLIQDLKPQAFAHPFEPPQPRSRKG